MIPGIKRYCITKMLIIAVAILGYSMAKGQDQIHISLSGNDQNSGSLQKPVRSLQRALHLAGQSKRNTLTIFLHEGVYHSAKTIRVDNSFNLAGKNVVITSFRQQKVVISGGYKIGANWQAGKFRNQYYTKVSSLKNFHSLFNAEKIVPRCSSEYLQSAGAEAKDKGLYKKYGFQAIRNLADNNLAVFCSFRFAESKEINSIKDIQNAEVIVYNSWDASWHQIQRIDNDGKVITFKNPLTYPVGFFKDVLSFRIENSISYFNKPGEWFLDKQSGELWYYANEGENPNQMDFVIPQLDTLISLNGTDKLAIKNIQFNNLTFAYSGNAWGVSDFSEQQKTDNKKRFPSLDFSVGFASNQGAIKCGAAITLLYAEQCSFNNCTFRNLGNYALRIGEYSHGNLVCNSSFTSLGGGGVIIGVDIKGGKKPQLPDQLSPARDSVLNNTISTNGLFFPSAVGIMLMQANYAVVRNNSIFNMPYTGISVGWTWAEVDNYTYYNIVERNKIHDVMQVLSDGGGIYTLGRQDGARYAENYIFNVKRGTTAIGEANNGFFFDQGSSNFTVADNVVENTLTANPIRFNQVDSGKIRFHNNFFSNKIIIPQNGKASEIKLKSGVQ